MATLKISIVGNGSVTSNVGGINCPGVCSGTILNPTPPLPFPPYHVTLTAVPDPNWKFVKYYITSQGFAGDMTPPISTNAIQQFTYTHGDIESNYEILAEFEPIPPTPPGVCFQLVSCDDCTHLSYYVLNNLTPYIGQFINVGGFCFQVKLLEPCPPEGAGAVNMFPGTDPNLVPVFTPYTDCCECLGVPNYLLTDCTYQTPAVSTGTNLSPYVGKTIKICNFETPLSINITASTPHCIGGYNLIMIAQITNPVSGFFYDGSNILKPYTNPSMFPLFVGTVMCLSTVAPYVIVGTGTDPDYSIQFLTGIVPITNIIPISTGMTMGMIQYLITINSLDPNLVITVDSFGSTLDVTLTVVDSTEETIFICNTTSPNEPPFGQAAAINAGCICYTVSELPPCPPLPLLTLGITEIYPDCECCLPPPIPPQEPPIPQFVEPVVRHHYLIPDSQCDIDANTVFAAMTYDQYRQLQYGMQSCCPFNINKIWLEKEISDLSKTKC